MGKAYWIFESNYKHYRNFAVGETVFVTTRALDFAPVFAAPAAADLMTASLFDDCRHYGVRLWAFVVMPTHLHFLADLREGQSASSFVERVKSNSGKRVASILDPFALATLAVQKGLGHRVFWQRGFRSVPITNREAFDVKLEYIHRNPAKAGLCDEPAGYRWSSAWMLEAGYGSWESGLVLPPEVLRDFADEEALSLWSRKGKDS